MVPNCQQMKWKIFGNLINVVGHNLENTEFLTEFRVTCSKCVQLIPTSQKLLKMVRALFWISLRIIGATRHLKLHNLENTEHSAEFFKSPKNDSKPFQMVKLYPSMSQRIFGHIFKLKGHNLENRGFILTIWNSLESVLRLSKKFRGMFRGRFRVYQIVSFL